jgi:hypothetical protein
LYFGGEKQKIPMLFDTGSPMMYVLTDKCDANLCPQVSKFMAQDSMSYRANVDGKEPLAHCYGQGCVSGANSRDTICFSEDPKSCMNGINFLAVDEASDIDKDKFSGIVGLGPMSDEKRLLSFIQQMSSGSGLGGVGGKDEIKPMFSFFLSNNEQKNGKLLFGGYNLAKYGAPGASDESIYWADMAHKKQFFWTINMGETKFADGKKLDISSKFLILDSGLSYALIPS